MAGSLKGIVIEIGGDTTKLGNALEGVNKHTRSLQSELKGVEKLLKMNPGNTELLAQKQQLLTEAIAETTQKLNTLKGAQEEVQKKWEAYGEAKPQLEALAKEIADTEKQLKALKQQQEEAAKAFEEGKISEEQYKEITQAVKDCEGKLKSLKTEQRELSKKVVNDEQYRDFQREIVYTEGNLRDLNSELQRTESDIESAGDAADDSANAMEDLGDASEQSSDGFTVMKGALADLISNGVQKAIEVIGNLISALFDLSDATKEYQTMQAKLMGSAGQFGYSADYAKQKYAEFYSYVGDDQMATNAITNLMALGGATDDTSSLASAAIAVWSAYGDSIPIESLTESITETAQVGKVTGNLADALNWAGISEDYFNTQLSQCMNTQQRAKLIADTLNNTYGESKAIYDSLNGSIVEQNRAELELRNTQALLGEAMRPVNTVLTELKTQILIAITPLVLALADAFLNLLTWLKEHPAVLYTVISAVLALAVAFGVLALAMAIHGIIAAVSAAFTALGGAMVALPVILVVALIGLIVSALVTLWNNCEAFRNFWIGLWEGLKSAVNSFVTFFNELPGKISSAWSSAVQSVKSWGAKMVSEAKSAARQMVDRAAEAVSPLPGKIQSALTTALEAAKSWGINLISVMGSAISNAINYVVSIARQLPAMFVSIGSAIIDGIAQGIYSAIGRLYSIVSNALNGLVSAAKSVLGINSPSKVFANTVGVAIPEGVAQGVKDKTGVAKRAVIDMASEMTDGAEGLNTATIERRVTATFAAEPRTGTADISTLAGKLDNIYDRLTRLQIVLDTGTLVGETIEKIDAGLAVKQRLAERGA